MGGELGGQRTDRGGPEVEPLELQPEAAVVAGFVAEMAAALLEQGCEVLPHGWIQDIRRGGVRLQSARCVS